MVRRSQRGLYVDCVKIGICSQKEIKKTSKISISVWNSRWFFYKLSKARADGKRFGLAPLLIVDVRVFEPISVVDIKVAIDGNLSLRMVNLQEVNCIGK